ncbi:Mce family protein Mce4A [Mycobacterium parmense]|uniref:Mce family protein Mce4A n=1 Tax=Mycobacterium parmense TaxID=185642 RepID=A0A7I7Z1Y8_9MYCO|nr:Mce family protein Mce4A [Mycobacterium parmense]
MRLAAALLAGLIVAFAALTYLSYTAAFASVDTVTVSAPRAGLVMDKGAKVKYRGIQVGKVESIDYATDQARLTLAINSDDMHFIPSNATVHIAGNTIFGAKSVEFIPPRQPSPSPLRPDAHVAASAVQLEVNTLFQSLIDLLHKIDPVELNGTLSALSEGLRGHGDDLGDLLGGLNTLSRQANPKLPALQEDFRKAGVVTNIYADAAPDLNTVIDNLPTISKTVVDQQGNLNDTLLAAIGLANNAYDTLAPAEQDFIDAINRLRAPLKVASDYSPEFGCLFAGIGRGIKEFAPLIGVRKAGLFTSSSFVLGAPAYTYPESLPIVNGSGGPNCRGLPDLPTKQTGGSFYRAPFLVTDNANIPYEPFTELQFDAPSTLQFLFHGAFAERDDF